MVERESFRNGIWIELAIVIFAVVLAASAASQVGLHHYYAMRRGVQTSANLQFVRAPRFIRMGKAGGYQDFEAVVVYQRAPNYAPRVTLPVSVSFFRRYKDKSDVPLSIHFLPGSLLRPVIDEDPPTYAWRWPLVIILAGLAAAALVRQCRNDYGILMRIVRGE